MVYHGKIPSGRQPNRQWINLLWQWLNYCNNEHRMLNDLEVPRACIKIHGKLMVCQIHICGQIECRWIAEYLVHTILDLIHLWIQWWIKGRQHFIAVCMSWAWVEILISNQDFWTPFNCLQLYDRLPQVIIARNLAQADQKRALVQHIKEAASRQSIARPRI